jgi:hypothetical protein
MSSRSRRPAGLTIVSALFIGVFVFSVLPLLPRFLAQGLREGIAVEGKNPFTWVPSLGSVILKTLLFIGAAGIYSRREIFRKILFAASAFFALGFPWFFPLAPFELKAQEVLREAGSSPISCSVADLSAFLPAFSAAAYLVFYFGTVLFFLWFVLYLCHPAVKRWFRRASADLDAPEHA